MTPGAPERSSHAADTSVATGARDLAESDARLAYRAET